jgi:hypothetical protein
MLITLASCATLVTGCGKTADVHICWLQQGASIQPKPTPVADLAATDKQMHYLSVHSTVPESSTVLYVEKLRRFDEWGKLPAGHEHPVHESVQLSVVLPRGATMKPGSTVQIDSSSPVAVTRWYSEFYKGWDTPDGRVEYPLDINVGTASGMIETRADGTVHGSVRFNGTAVWAERIDRRVTSQRSFSFSCTPRVVPTLEVRPCLGQAFSNCDKDFVVQEVSPRSDFQYCFKGIEQCYTKYASSIESTPLVDATARAPPK